LTSEDPEYKTRDHFSKAQERNIQKGISKGSKKKKVGSQEEFHSLRGAERSLKASGVRKNGLNYREVKGGREEIIPYRENVGRAVDEINSIAMSCTAGERKGRTPVYESQVRKNIVEE